MSVPAPRGLALAGSILAIVTGALILVLGVVALGAGAGGGGVGAIVGLIFMLVAAAAITLGAIGCTIKPGVILANAIVFSLLSLLALVGIARGAHALDLLMAVLCVTTCVFLWVGFAQALRYRQAQRSA